MTEKVQTNKMFDEVQKLGLVVETVPRVVHDQFIYILGHKLDAEDLLETLIEVKSDPSGTYLNDPKMVDTLKAIGVITGTSGSWGTSIDERGGKERLSQLIAMLRDALKASEESES
ncbi:MAG: hypothetical protein EOO74_10350 [Myxococcales bacterium]|nr:MAG: hypothetical protein EOO74_10350 [Myxococcales bacterium]